MTRKCSFLRAVLALLCFHMATDSGYVTVPQNVLWNALQLALACSMLSPHLVICLGFLCGFCLWALLLVSTLLCSFVLLQWELQYRKDLPQQLTSPTACSWPPQPEGAAISQQQQNTELLGSFSLLALVFGDFSFSPRMPPSLSG